MLYLVYVLTFLAGILFYALSPRDDQVNLDTYRAEGFIVSFLAQHQAAKDYMTQWLGFNLTSATQFNLTTDMFGNFLPVAMFDDKPLLKDMEVHYDADISDDQNNTEAAGYQKIAGNTDAAYQTTVICTTRTSDIPVACNGVDVQPYLITYNGASQRPEWWPKETNNRQRRYGTWRNAFSYRTNGSRNCGVLVCGQYWDKDNFVCRTAEGASDAKGYWCVDNGQAVRIPGQSGCAQQVPLAVSSALGCESGACSDTFFCISKVKQGPDRYYVSGLTAFYDGINNQNTGAEGNRNEGSIKWTDLVRPDSTKQANVSDGDVNFDTGLMASQSGVTFPDFRIVNSSGTLFRDFTLTILLKGAGSTYDMDIKFLDLGSLQFHLVGTGANKPHIEIQFSGLAGNNDTIPSTPTPLPIDVNQNIISLTVIGSPTALNVYANAGSTPIATLTETDWETKKGASSPEATMMTYYPDLVISTEANTAYIYGVRYYQNKALSVTRRTIKGHFVPSELEQNFKMDSKRYGIGSDPSLKPTF